MHGAVLSSLVVLQTPQCQLCTAGSYSSTCRLTGDLAGWRYLQTIQCLTTRVGPQGRFVPMACLSLCGFRANRRFKCASFKFPSTSGQPMKRVERTLVTVSYDILSRSRCHKAPNLAKKRSENTSHTKTICIYVAYLCLTQDKLGEITISFEKNIAASSPIQSINIILDP